MKRFSDFFSASLPLLPLPRTTLNCCRLVLAIYLSLTRWMDEYQGVWGELGVAEDQRLGLLDTVASGVLREAEAKLEEVGGREGERGTRAERERERERERENGVGFVLDGSMVI